MSRIVTNGATIRDIYETVSGGCGVHARMAAVRIGMTMPVMEPDLDAGTLHSWATTIDDGPFSSLCWGERMAFDNPPECLTFLGAVAAWTRRVPPWS